MCSRPCTAASQITFLHHIHHTHHLYHTPPESHPPHPTPKPLTTCTTLTASTSCAVGSVALGSHTSTLDRPSYLTISPPTSPPVNPFSQFSQVSRVLAAVAPKKTIGMKIFNSPASPARRPRGATFVNGNWANQDSTNADGDSSSPNRKPRSATLANDGKTHYSDKRYESY